MSIVKYYVRIGSAAILKAEVDKETAQSVWLAGGHRRAKLSSYENYLDTWEAARDLLAADAAKKLGYAKAAVQRASDYAGNVKGLKNPEAA